MTIRNHDGQDYHVTGEGQGIYNTVAGSLGLASFLGFNSGNFMGMRNGCGCNCSELVTKSELNYVQELARKDSEIALLKSEQNTEIKIADVYDRLLKRINDDRREQEAINTQQAVLNAATNGTLSVLTNQVNCLMSLTKLVVPASNVCPQPMPLHNSWTAPTTTTPAA